MPHAVTSQSSFLGGEWNPAAQGRSDHAWYKTALNACINAIITEEGGWLRRSGTEFLGPTYLRQQATIRTIYNDSNHRYAVSLTTNGSTGWANFFQNDTVLVDSPSYAVTSSSSSAGVLTLVLASTPSPAWVDGDQILLSAVPATGAQYLNRWMNIESSASGTITLKDDTDTAFGFDSSPNAVAGATANRITRVTHGILGNLALAQVVNLGVETLGDPITSLLMAPGQIPQLISFVASPLSFSIGPAFFVDGPYLDASGDTGTVTGYSGSITFTPAAYVFSATDVGRAIRLFTQPAAWAIGTTYSYGDTVTDASGAWWQSVANTPYTNVGVTPGTLYTASSGAQVVFWSPAPTAGTWAWGLITAQAGSSATVGLQTDLNSANGTTVSSYQLGVYGSGGVVYPTNGTLCEGRLYLGGAIEGRFDASNSNAYLTFSPTDPNGNVFDNLSIDFSISSPSQDHVTWFVPVKEGLELGTVAGEYLLTAGSGSAITPSNLQLVQSSSYGSVNTPAVVAGVTTIFLQSSGQRVIEYVVDVFATAPSGRTLNEFAKHLASFGGFAELSYQEAKTPIVWARQNDGRLIGCTYRRFSRFMSQPADYEAWHQHWIADGLRLNISQCVVPNIPGSTTDELYMITEANGAGPAFGVELLTAEFGDI